MFTIRKAMPGDVPALRALMHDSVRGLSRGFYTEAQVESALRHVLGPDTQLIADGTYHVVTTDDGAIVAAGGWSRRRTLYGGDQAKREGDDPVLDPATEPARIRAFYVHPDWARRGLARQLYARCAADAAAAGFRELELVATLPGEPLYRALGFRAVEPADAELPDGARLPAVRMVRALDDAPAR
jgi:predicted N-acetyltransferase YhbS